MGSAGSYRTALSEAMSGRLAAVELCQICVQLACIVAQNGGDSAFIVRAAQVLAEAGSRMPEVPRRVLRFADDEAEELVQF